MSALKALASIRATSPAGGAHDTLETAENRHARAADDGAETRALPSISFFPSALDLSRLASVMRRRALNWLILALYRFVLTGLVPLDYFAFLACNAQ